METTSKARLSELVSAMSEAEAESALGKLRSSRSAVPLAAEGDGYSNELVIETRKIRDLRYGENHHQVAALYATARPPRGVAGARQLHGPPMSFTNWLDADAGLRVVGDFEQPAAAIIKHTNPCGFAFAENVTRAYELAFDCDSRAAYGGVVAVNRAVDEALVRSLGELFLNVCVAPAVAVDVVAKLREGLRLLVVDRPTMPREPDVRSIDGGLLIQSQDSTASLREARAMTRLQPNPKQWRQLLTAWKLSSRVKSNAIVIVRDETAVGVGAGQMSRIEAAELAVHRAGSRAVGAVAASDGLIPFPDVVEALAAAGVRAVVQPGGSVGDEEVVAAADNLGLAMVRAGERHFRH